MKREVIFVLLFGAIFYGLFLIGAWLQSDLEWPAVLLPLPLILVALAGLRVLTRALGAQTQAASYLEMLVELPYVGTTLTLGIAIVPFMALFGLGSLFGELPEDNRWVNGLFLTIGAMLTYGWLRLLERWAGLSIKLPLVPVRAVWITPVILLGGLVWLVYPEFFLESGSLSE